MESGGSIPIGAGLARYRFPSGELIDRVATDLFPTGPPCWEPGTAAAVIFAAGDGRLYRHVFEPFELSTAQQPARLTWDSETLPDGSYFVCDPFRPPAGNLSDGLLASVSVRQEEGSRRWFRAPQVWWLRLNPSRDAILTAEPLTDESDGHSRRFPIVAGGEDTPLRLASLVRHGGESWSLAVAPLGIDPETGVPRFDPSSESILARGVCPTPPAVSSDGRWITVMVRQGRRTRPLRLPLAEDQSRGLPTARGDAGRPPTSGGRS
jgi:hypothetical protein